jgi:hypothetical protein
MTDPSGFPETKTVPPEIDRWNWGAFLLNWIWGVGNNTYIALLTLVPFFGILIMPFVLGAKGGAWAWRNGRWDSIEHFKRVQRRWAIWGVVICLGFVLFFAGTFGSVFYTLRHSAAYEMGVAKIQSSPEVANLLGTPITTGLPFGSLKFNGPSGTAALTFSVTGAKAAGRAYVEAIKMDGVWTIKSLKLKIDGRDDMIDLANPIKAETDPSTEHIARKFAAIGAASDVFR